MISRVADHCFWLGRYLERTESTARVLAVTRNLSLDAALQPRQCWLPVVIVAGEEAAFARRHGPAGTDDGERVQDYLTWDAEVGVSIRRSVAAARDNARSMREVVSLETWEALNELNLWLAGPMSRTAYRKDRHAFYRRIRQAVQGIHGIARGTMLHDDALSFLDLGVRLEAAGQTARVLDVHHHAFSQVGSPDVVETALWLSLLRSCSGFEPFMKRHQAQVTAAAVARFLVLAPDFPRSVRFCIRSAWDQLSAIRPPETEGLPGARSVERLSRLSTWLDQCEPMLTGGGLHGLLTHIVDETAAICDWIGLELLGYEVTPAPHPAPPQ
jgi:uncharacterized alpha-E superfamily protein